MISSLDKAKEIVDKISNNMNEIIKEYDDEYKLIRDLYVNNDEITITEEQINEKKNRIERKSRSVSPKMRTKLIISKESEDGENLIEEKKKIECDEEDYNKFLMDNIKKQQKVDEVYRKMRNWCIDNNILTVPTRNVFINNIENKNMFKRIIKKDIEYIIRINEEGIINRVTKEEMPCNILKWFEEKYEYTNGEIIYKLKDIHNEFIDSIYYCNLTKDEKRKYNRTYFDEYFETNIDLRQYFIIKQKVKCIKGWNKIINENDNTEII